MKTNACFTLVVVAWLVGCSSGDDKSSPPPPNSDGSTNDTLASETENDASPPEDATVDTPVAVKTGWTSEPTPGEISITGLHGTGPKDVWAVGNVSSSKSAVIHYDGSAWSTFADLPAPAKDVWAATAKDAWLILDYPGTIYRFDGATWNKSSTLGVSSVYALWGRSATDVWLAFGG